MNPEQKTQALSNLDQLLDLVSRTRADPSQDAVGQFLSEAVPLHQSLCNQFGMGKWFQNVMRPEPDPVKPRQEIDWTLPSNENEILIIEAKNGNERKTIHLWVEQQNARAKIEGSDQLYNSFSANSAHFEPCQGWQCKACGSFFYWSEMKFYNDYTTRGNYYGSYYKCTNCFDDFFYSGDDMYRDEIISGVFNTVIVCLRQTRFKDIKKKLNLEKGTFRKHRHYWKHWKTGEEFLSAEAREFTMTYPVDRLVKALHLKNSNDAK